ncbi:MAG: adenine deaminase C-terminal domain-containing protein, partial [Nitrososphaerota archaeon]
MSFEVFIGRLAKEIKAEKVVKGGVLINVFTGELYEADVAIYGNRILAVGDVKGFMNNGTKVIDATGYYLSPGLIDGHIHVECSKLSITMFAKLVLPRGTTAIVSGLDQIYVVAGLRGVKNFLTEATKTPLKVFWGAPCKLPYTIPPSTVGFKFGAKEHRTTQLWPHCVGVWETVKEFVLESDREVIQAMKLARKNRLSVYGCAPMIDPYKLQLYAASGIRADHESYSAEETLSKVRSGVYGMIRESSVAHFLKENIKVVTNYKVNPKIICFCTDDVIASDVIRRGHLDNLVRMAIQEGVDPIKAIQMATINCAEAYRIDHEVGLIAPGRIADILMVTKPETFTVERVIANGELVASKGRMIVDLLPPKRGSSLTKTIKSEKVKPDELVIKTRVKSGVAEVLSMKVSEDVPFVRKKRIAKLRVKDGLILPDIVQDVLYVAVLDRYHRKGRKAVAFISGFKLRSGAVASSAAPDDNNILCIGTNPRDMAIAINHIIE